jgi:hypothetical protein
MRSVLTGARRIAQCSEGRPDSSPDPGSTAPARSTWGVPALQFAVREPFPSRSSQTNLVYGHITPETPLRIRSRMAEGGVIFSDGMEADFLRFTAGMEALITIAPQQGWLVV